MNIDNTGAAHTHIQPKELMCAEFNCNNIVQRSLTMSCKMSAFGRYGLLIFADAFELPALAIASATLFFVSLSSPPPR